MAGCEGEYHVSTEQSSKVSPYSATLLNPSLAVRSIITFQVELVIVVLRVRTKILLQADIQYIWTRPLIDIKYLWPGNFREKNIS